MQKQYIPLILPYNVLVLGLIALLSLPVNSQPKQYDFSTIRLNGLDINGKYTREQLIAAFGEPDEEDEFMYNYLVYKRTQTPLISKSGIGVHEQQPIVVAIDYIGYDINRDGTYQLAVFTINSARIVLNDYIRLGDPISKVGDMGGYYLQGEYNDGSEYLYWHPDGGFDINRVDWTLYPRFDYDDKGIITKIQLYYD